MIKILSKQRLGILGFLILVSIFSFSWGELNAVTESIGVNYLQVSRHGNDDTASNSSWSYYPGDRNDYYAADVAYQILGHRHGSSEIRTEIWLNGSRGEGRVDRFYCEGSLCGYEYNGDAEGHPFNFRSGGSITADSSSSAGSNFRIYRYGYVKDAEVRVSMSAAAYYNDDPTPPPPEATPKTLTVSKGGTGSGTVSGPGISCGSDCAEPYDSGTNVSLSAAPASPSTFGGWGGDCSGTGGCTVTMNNAMNVTATFNAAPPPGHHTLSVVRSGTGSGTVNSNPSGITCGSDCAQAYTAGTSVTLTRTIASGSTFTGWSGACSGTSATCTVTMNASKSVTATFTSSEEPPTGGSCVENASVVITSPIPATLNPGQSYSFSLTSQNIGGTNGTSWYHGSAYAIEKTNGPTVVAQTCRNGSYLGTDDYGQICNISTPTNGVIQDWTFAGTAPSAPGEYLVSMRMNHAAGYEYKLPSGAVCKPAPTSPVKFGNNADMLFTVVQPVYTLTAAIGSGSGSVNTTGISCPGDCSETFNGGTAVIITATPATDYAFSSWSGACAGQGSSCSLTMDSDKSVTANFTYTTPFNYSLSNSGTSNAVKTSGTVYTQNTITKTLISGVTQPVDLTGLSGLPTGTTYSVSNNPCSPNCSSVITISVSPTTPVGTYPLTVTGSPLNKQTTFNLVVSGNPANLTCSGSPATILLGQSVTWTATVSGGTPPFTYRWIGTNIPTNPAPTTNPYTITYNTVGTKTASATVTDADGLQATCPFTGPGSGTIQVNFDPRFEEF